MALAAVFMVSSHAAPASADGMDEHSKEKIEIFYHSITGQEYCFDTLKEFKDFLEDNLEECELTIKVKVSFTLSIGGDVGVANSETEQKVEMEATFTASCDKIWKQIKQFIDGVRSLAS